MRLLFIPGFMQRGDAWRPVAELLPERYPSILLEHSQHSFAGRLGEIADAGEGSVLVGYSLGGRLALHAALRDPARYGGLVTVGTAAGIEDPAQRSARAEADARLADWMETRSIEEIVSVWERQPLFADQSEGLIDAQRPGRLAQDPLQLAELLRTAGQGALEPVWDELGRLGLPVLAIAGARDDRYAEAAERIAASVPNGSTALVEHAGHAAHLQRPEIVAALLMDLVDRHLG